MKLIQKQNKTDICSKHMYMLKLNRMNTNSKRFRHFLSFQENSAENLPVHSSVSVPRIHIVLPPLVCIPTISTGDKLVKLMVELGMEDGFGAEHSTFTRIRNHNDFLFFV